MSLSNCFNNEQFKKQVCGSIIDDAIKSVINDLTTKPDVLNSTLLALLADESMIVSPVDPINESLDYFFIFDDDTKKGRIELNFRYVGFRAAMDNLKIKENNEYDISKIFSEVPTYDFVIKNDSIVLVETKFKLTNLWGHVNIFDGKPQNYVNVVLREV